MDWSQTRIQSATEQRIVAPPFLANILQLLQEQYPVNACWEISQINLTAVADLGLWECCLEVSSSTLRVVLDFHFSEALRGEELRRLERAVGDDQRRTDPIDMPDRR